jgi:hypothetical protein
MGLSPHPLGSLMTRIRTVASRLTRVSLLLGIAALVPGCTFETMTVELGWGTSLTTCFEAGVTSMDYTLVDSSGVVRSETNLPCGDLQFSSLAIDNYELDIYGFDRFGNETYAATCTGIFFDGEEITHRCTVPPSGDPLLVEVRWDLSELPDDFLAGTCAQAGVRDYDVTLYDGATVVSSSVEVLCTNGTLVLDFGAQPAGNYSLEVTGYADDGNAYWFGDCLVSPSAFGQSRCDARDDG